MYKYNIHTKQRLTMGQEGGTPLEDSEGIVKVRR